MDLQNAITVQVISITSECIMEILTNIFLNLYHPVALWFVCLEN